MTTAHPDGRITTERTDHVFQIGIDRPKKLNAFSPKMLTEMAEALTAFERDEEAWVALASSSTDGLDIGSIIGQIIAGGASGGVLTAIVSILRGAMAK